MTSLAPAIGNVFATILITNQMNKGLPTDRENAAEAYRRMSARHFPCTSGVSQILNVSAFTRRLLVCSWRRILCTHWRHRWAASNWYSRHQRRERPCRRSCGASPGGQGHRWRRKGEGGRRRGCQQALGFVVDGPVGRSFRFGLFSRIHAPTFKRFSVTTSSAVLVWSPGVLPI